MSNVEMRPALTLDAAKKLIGAGQAKAAEMGLPMTIAVVDPAGDLIAFERMNGARLVSVGFALGKAESAAKIGRSTQQYCEMLEKDAIIGRLMPTSGLMLLPGGIPVVVEGQMAGAVGVSGGHYSQDQAVAEAACAALEG